MHCMRQAETKKPPKVSKKQFASHLTGEAMSTPSIDASPSIGKDEPAAPSAFVTKLYQMVNGSPEDIVSWVPSGDAFLIQNLSKLESEALPRFFRHARFQSLVRQLNFYNFRKVNRERTFWVYRHPLFHRDRPQDLHLLKRRSVVPSGGSSGKRRGSGSSRSNDPFVDEDGCSVGEKDGYDPNQSFDENMENESVSASSFEEDKNPLKRKATQSSMNDDWKRGTEEGAAPGIRPSRNVCRAKKPFAEEDSSFSVGQSVSEDEDGSKKDGDGQRQVFVLFPEGTHDAKNVTPPQDGYGREQDEAPSVRVPGAKVKSSRSERMEQSQLVSQVAQKLQGYAKRASDGPRSRSRSCEPSTHGGIVTPPASSIFKFSDTMKYNALTYDDEVVQVVAHTGKTFDKTGTRTKCDVVTDGEDICVENEAASVTSDANHSGTNLGRARIPSTFALPAQSKSDVLNKRSNDFKGLASPDGSHLGLPPIRDSLMIAVVHQKILRGSIYDNEEEKAVGAAICRLCMSTAPNDLVLGKKAALLMETCSGLGREFRRYCIALCPHLYPPNYKSANPQHHHLVSLKPQEKDHNQDVEFDRVFRSFALHWLEDILRHLAKQGSAMLDNAEKKALKKSAEVWLESAMTNH